MRLWMAVGCALPTSVATTRRRARRLVRVLRTRTARVRRLRWQRAPVVPRVATRSHAVPTTWYARSPRARHARDGARIAMVRIVYDFCLSTCDGARTVAGRGGVEPIECRHPLPACVSGWRWGVHCRLLWRLPDDVRGDWCGYCVHGLRESDVFDGSGHQWRHEWRHARMPCLPPGTRNPHALAAHAIAPA